MLTRLHTTARGLESDEGTGLDMLQMPVMHTPHSSQDAAGISSLLGKLMTTRQTCNTTQLKLSTPAGDSGKPWGSVGRMPQAGQRCFESAQLACYERGQQFMSHEVCHTRNQKKKTNQKKNQGKCLTCLRQGTAMRSALGP